MWKPETYLRGDWDLRGGHRVWATRPMADENEDTYATDNGPCSVELFADGFRLTGAENPHNRTRRGIEVRALTDHMFEVDNFLENTGDMLYSGGVWALTCTVPGAATKYAIPVSDGSDWDTFTMVHFRRWGGHGVGGLNDTQIEQTEDMLVITPRGIENKRMVQSRAGIMVMTDTDRNFTFAKKTPYCDSATTYPQNTNLAFYIGPENFMVEMESMSPEQPLRPGDIMHHKETWVFRDEATPLTSADDLTSVFKGTDHP